jgi:hypothetical protein
MLGIKTLLKGYVKPGPPCGRTLLQFSLKDPKFFLASLRYLNASSDGLIGLVIGNLFWTVSHIVSEYTYSCS